MASHLPFFASLAIVVYIITLETMAIPRGGCCYSEQYEGKLYITKGDFDQVKNSASITHTEASVHLDHSKQIVALEAVSTSQPGDVVREYRMIEDFGKDQGWYIQGKTCYKIAVTTPNVPAPCIPDGSTLVGKFKVGRNETVQTWVLPNTNNSALQRLTVTDNSCVPLTTTSVEFGKKSSMTTTLFGNMTKGIADPSVFVVPSFCQQP